MHTKIINLNCGNLVDENEEVGEMEVVCVVMSFI